MSIHSHMLSEPDNRAAVNPAVNQHLIAGKQAFQFRRQHIWHLSQIIVRSLSICHRNCAMRHCGVNLRKKSYSYCQMAPSPSRPSQDSELRSTGTW